MQNTNPTPSHMYPRVIVATSGSRLKFIEIRRHHLEEIRLWRNSQIRYLRQKKEIGQSEQIDYFEEVAWPEMTKKFPRQMIYMLDLNSAVIGYGGLVNIDWTDSRAEISFLLDPELEADKNFKRIAFSLFLREISDLAFLSLGIHRLFTETYASRLEHIRILEECNFVLEGTLRDHVKTGETFENSLIHGKLITD